MKGSRGLNAIVRQRQVRRLLDTLLLGVVGALSARLFEWLLGVGQKVFLEGIAGYTPPELGEQGRVLAESSGPWGLWLVPVALLVGGFVSGLLIYSLAPEAEGHGTDTVVYAVHEQNGFIFLPHRTTVLERGDQLLLLLSSEARETIRRHCDPLDFPGTLPAPGSSRTSGRHDRS